MDGAALGVEILVHQTNHEGELIDRLQAASGEFAAVVLNPGGLSHTSVSLRDAVSAFPGPVVEVHMSNVAAREPFRHVAMTGGAAAGVISGFKGLSYRLALRAALSLAGGSM